MRRLIQVIDDGDDDRHMLRRVFEREGFEVWEAPNGAVALRQLLASEVLPALILVDFKMPVINGQEFLEAVAKHHRFRNIFVVVVTGWDIDDPRFKYPVMRKPVPPEKLLLLAHQACTSGHPPCKA